MSRLHRRALALMLWVIFCAVMFQDRDEMSKVIMWVGAAVGYVSLFWKGGEDG